LGDIGQYKKAGYFHDTATNIEKYFGKISSEGCLMVERENGPDEIIDNVRQDIFERFKMLRNSM
jgi:hypothetical protein